jgi:6-phosphogluconolactonase (cycloisomerase 2 family)
MRTRFTWVLAILVLVSIGVLVACSSKYSSSSNGLVVVPSQGDAVVQSFSVNLSNGSISAINNVNGPPTGGIPNAVVLDPAGAFAYVIIYANPAVPASVTGIGAFQVASDGKLAAGTTAALNNASVQVQVPCGNTTPPPPTESVPVNPVAMAIDSAGKFLFVADSATSDSCGNHVPGAVSVFSVSNGTLAEVAGSPFVLPVDDVNLLPQPQRPCTSLITCSSASALAVTPTAYPELYSYCSGRPAPTTENLYVTDSANYTVLNYSVDPSAGALSLALPKTDISVPTGPVPSGVAVDPCNRFLYVSNAGAGLGANTVSAYTICSSVSLPACPGVDFSLHQVASPYPVGDAPGPLAVDAYGGFLYVVDTGSNQVSQFRISSSTGALTALTPPTAPTGSGANSIAIRSDDSWVFVSNLNSATVSQYSLGLSNGILTPQTPFQTFNYPSGVAVK